MEGESNPATRHTPPATPDDDAHAIDRFHDEGGPPVDDAPSPFERDAELGLHGMLTRLPEPPLRRRLAARTESHVPVRVAGDGCRVKGVEDGAPPPARDRGTEPSTLHPSPPTR